jgi:hypothetical protein
MNKKNNLKITSKKGTLLIENIVFIIINLLFLAILILFIAKQGSGAIDLEQIYAKQISLIVDSAIPVSIVELNMMSAFEVAEKNGIDFDDIVKINGNSVFVKLSEDSGYEYSFFNNVDVTAYLGEEEGRYVFTINEINEDENEE